MAPAPRTILLVEDSPDDLALAEAAFAELGLEHRLQAVIDGEEALEVLLGGEPSTWSARADLVLLDLQLPGIDGFEVLRRLRADPRVGVVPVVVLTSSVEDEDVLTCYRLGANSYVRKPTDFDEFVPMLREILEYWLTLNRAPPREPS
jgi:two-component system response regulator